MSVIPIFPFSESRKMNVALFISGSGTNGLRIIERAKESDSNFKITLIFSDIKNERKRRDRTKMCYAKDIAEENNLAYEFVDIRDFYSDRGVKRTDLSIRPDYDQLVLEKLKDYELDLIANAGYMSIMTPVILDKYNGKIVNVHPADLSIMDRNKRKYVGIHVVEEAIMAGESEIRSSTHIVREEVDHGEILLISKPVEIDPTLSVKTLMENKTYRKKTISEYQSQLKKQGDWIIFPLTIQMISKGRIAVGPKGAYLDGNPIQNGHRIG